eukprot:Nitzschia sp. Nitz4//scaffold404_size10607//4274//7243//NITZ4_009068-RA/size10607-processed-gene-0.3-mRNA-1//-1//CDS//3329551102//4749//frame0
MSDNTTTNNNNTNNEELLSQCVSSLTTGARAVQSLPLGDELEFLSSFPECSSLLEQNQQDLVETISMVLEEFGTDVVDVNVVAGLQLQDPLLWEWCSEVCDALLESASSSTASGSNNDNGTLALQQAKQTAMTSLGRLLQGVVDMDKPQDVHGLYTLTPAVRNGRTHVFLPPGQEDASLEEGSGWETRFGAWRPPRKHMPEGGIVAPAHHVPHPYRSHLESLECTLEPPATKPEKIPVCETLQATWVDTPEALEALTAQLEDCTALAMDLEAHSYRTFSGITCLIQLTVQRAPDAAAGTTTRQNYLIDPFPLWKWIGPALTPALTNPAIVKVMHGAESDMQWLQRDFGLYVVQLFDTYCAAKALQHGRYGYAHLLQRYVGITPDKTHQLADWRQRPLPAAMQQYAIMDTHYLLDVCQHLLYDLDHSKESSIEEVWQRSKQVSSIRYAPEPFIPEGYASLLRQRRGSSSKTEMNATQEQVLKVLWDWRDTVARTEDESLLYVCPNPALTRLALACPTNLKALQGLLQPMPPLVLRYAKQVLGLVQRCVKPPFFKPAGMEVDNDEDPAAVRSLMSPVLGTEALYQQAGWISPTTHEGEGGTTGDKDDDDEPQMVVDVVTTTDEEGGAEQQQTPSRRVLRTNQANKNYASNVSSAHSLHLGGKESAEGGSSNRSTTAVVDGMGSVRAVHSNETTKECQLAQSTAAAVTGEQEKQSVFDLVSPDEYTQEANDEDDNVATDGAAAAGTAEEEFVIPRSIREIYRISNRNRRNKKSSSPVVMEPNEREAQELAEAEEILNARAKEGKSYFEDLTPPGTPKRQRTKSTSDDQQGGNSNNNSATREEDISFMQEIGWIQGKEEAATLMKKQQSGRGAPEETEEQGDATGGNNSSDEETPKQQIQHQQPTPSFDYSSVGPIGASRATPSSNPFLAGAATAGGYLNQQQSGKSEAKKKNNAGRNKPGRGRPGGGGAQPPSHQVERPEKNRERVQAYKKR